MELLLPRSCAGCRAPGAVLCRGCQEELREPPRRVYRRSLLDVPVFTLGSYSEVRRNIILAMKEYNNRAVRPHIGAVIHAGLDYLVARGDIPATVVLVPAPTRKKSAALRGGDPVVDMCRATGREVHRCVRIFKGAADQSTLSAEERRNNMRRSVELYAPAPKSPVMVIDDVMTTGSTLAATIEVLRGAGAKIAGGLVFADV